MLSARSLELALFASLKTNSQLMSDLGGTRLYSEPYRGKHFPYVTLLVGPSRDWSTGTETGDEHQVTLHVWATTEKRSDVQHIMARIKQHMANASLSLTDHLLINLSYEMSDLKLERKDRISHGFLRYRAVTEPNMSS